MNDNIIFGSCAKHPQFNMVNCPMCFSEKATTVLGEIHKEWSRNKLGKGMMAECYETYQEGCELLNSDKNDERIASQQSINQGGDAGIKNNPQ